MYVCIRDEKKIKKKKIDNRSYTFICAVKNKTRAGLYFVFLAKNKNSHRVRWCVYLYIHAHRVYFKERKFIF